MLGRKQNITNEQFRECAENAHKYITREQLDQKIEQTIKRISDFCMGKNVAYAWSGGKDSIVLADICQKAGINQGVFGRCNLEYSEFISWAMENKPNSVKVYNSGQDLKWLAEHQQFLFPQGKNLSQWYHLVQHACENRYYKDNNLDIICLGRRKIDGNFTGKNGVTKKANGQVIFAPIYDWSHEEIFAYITYKDLAMPPIYDWEDGYKEGTHAWNETKMGKNISDSWRRVYDIEPQIVICASQYFDSAKQYLDSK